MEKIDKGTVYCQKCGTKNDIISSFCLNCGNELVSNNQNTGYKKDNKAQSIERSSLNNYGDTDEIMRFVGKNSQYYQNKFDTITKTGSKTTWNWAAFFLNIYWLLYRKMYLQAGGLFLVKVVLNFIPYIGWLVSIGVSIAFSMYANSIYLDHVQKKLSEINTLDYSQREFDILKKGGTNIVLPLAIVIGIFIIVIIAIVGFVVLLGMGGMYYY
ncbi:MAG: DUF2628 domain-containing protein [Peptostreptococcaceae bacterium]